MWLLEIKNIAWVPGGLNRRTISTTDRWELPTYNGLPSECHSLGRPWEPRIRIRDQEKSENDLLRGMILEDVWEYLAWRRIFQGTKHLAKCPWEGNWTSSGWPPWGRNGINIQAEGRLSSGGAAWPGRAQGLCWRSQAGQPHGCHSKEVMPALEGASRGSRECLPVGFLLALEVRGGGVCDYVPMSKSKTRVPLVEMMAISGMRGLAEGSCASAFHL